MAESQMPPRARGKGSSKPEKVYVNRPLHWMVKAGGYGTTFYLGFIFLATVIVDWETLGLHSEKVQLVCSALGVVAFLLSLALWRLADSLMGSD